MRVVITEFMDETAVADLATKHDTFYDRSLVDRPDELRARVATADALVVRNRTQVDATLLTGAPRLKVVGRLGVGLDNIDVDTCRARGIDVIPATGANAQAVAEYVIGSAMLLLRGAYFVVNRGRERRLAARRTLRRPGAVPARRSASWGSAASAGSWPGSVGRWECA